MTAAAAPLQTLAAKPQPLGNSTHAGLLLQRKCACGSPTSSLTGECGECGKQKLRLQTKLRINEPGDVYEQEADRVADQVMAASAHSPVSGAPPRIQRFSGQSNGQTEAAPASVDQTLASPGRPLDPALRHDMEQHFGHDFSRVRVHSGAAAEQSALDVNAHAYTVGYNIVFDAGRFAPGTHEGRRLIAHELAHVVQQDAAKSAEPLQMPMNAKATPTSSEVDPEFQQTKAQIWHTKDVQKQHSKPESSVASLVQRQPVDAAKPETGTAKTPVAAVEEVWNGLLAFSARATPQLSNVFTNVQNYLERYDAAYAIFTKRLSDAEKKAAEEDKWPSVLIGIIIGTGVGLAAGELLLAATAVRKVVYEVVGEAVEAGLAYILDPSSASKVNFAPPPEVAADKVARGYLAQLSKALLALALVEAAALAYSPRRDALRDAARATAGGGVQKAPPAKGPYAPLAGPTVAAELRRLKDALAAVEHALDLFLGTVDTPVLRRTPRTIEADLWIRWMSGSAANAGTLAGDGDIGARMFDLRVPSRLADPKGWFSLAPESVLEASKAEVRRLEQVGRFGVVVVPPKWPHQMAQQIPGAVHLRDDAYQAVGRLAPPTSGAQEYVRIAYQPHVYLRTGEVVVLQDTSPDGLIPQRLGKSLAVDPTEQAAALKVAGKDHGYGFPPEAVELLSGGVNLAVGGMRDVQPPLTTHTSEEGILVREADGTGLVLFAPYTSWGEARAAGARTGARLVVAVELDPNSGIKEWGGQDVLVTRHNDDRFFETQIRGVRALLGKGPKITVEQR